MPVPTFGEAKFPAWVSVTVSPDTTPLKLPSASAAVVVPSYTLPLTAVPSTVDTASRPAFALARVPLKLPNVRVSPFCSPDNTPVPVSASSVFALYVRPVPDRPVSVSVAGAMVTLDSVGCVST